MGRKCHARSVVARVLIRPRHAHTSHALSAHKLALFPSSSASACRANKAKPCCSIFFFKEIGDDEGLRKKNKIENSFFFQRLTKINKLKEFSVFLILLLIFSFHFFYIIRKEYTKDSRRVQKVSYFQRSVFFSFLRLSLFIDKKRPYITSLYSFFPLSRQVSHV